MAFFVYSVYVVDMRSGETSDDDTLIPASFRLTADELAEVEAIAEKEERKRSDVIRRLVREALAARSTTTQSDQPQHQRRRSA